MEAVSHPSSHEKIKGIPFHCCREKEVEIIKGKQIKERSEIGNLSHMELTEQARGSS